MKKFAAFTSKGSDFKAFAERYSPAEPEMLKVSVNKVRANGTHFIVHSRLYDEKKGAWDITIAGDDSEYLTSDLEVAIQARAKPEKYQD